MGSFEKGVQKRLDGYDYKFFHVDPFFGGAQKSDKEIRIMHGLEAAFEIGKMAGREEMKEFIPPGSFPGMESREGVPPGTCRDPDYYNDFALWKLHKLAGMLTYSHPVINGWRFSDREIDDSLGRILMLDTETSRKCNLECPYCYTREAGGFEGMEPEMPISDRKELIDEAAEIGCQTIKIVGAGEPLCDEDFWEQVNHIRYRGIVPIVFTNGILVSGDCAKRLYDLGASVILKCNSLDPKVEDAMVGSPGYAEKRDAALKHLQEAGFNGCYPTRLGFDAVVTQANKGGIINLFKHCRGNNIFPLFKPMIPKGGAAQMKDLEIPREELAAIYGEAREIDEKCLFFEHESDFPYIGGFACKDRRVSLYVDISGRAYPCVGSNQCLGDASAEPLSKIWTSYAASAIRRTPYAGCPPREGRP